jgi:hypothetical protein
MDYSEFFEYSDGQLIWKLRPRSAFSCDRGFNVHRNKYAGKVAGNLGQNGYFYVRVQKKLLLVHRVIWEMHNRPLAGREEVDHHDTNRTNNLIGNLRLASRHQNGCNMSLPAHNTTGFKGVSLHKATGRFAAYYKKHGKKHHIGYFVTAEEAHAAYVSAAKQEFLEFARS